MLQVSGCQIVKLHTCRYYYNKVLRILLFEVKIWYSGVVNSVLSVGEEDEVSIKETADMIIKAMDFKGKVIVSFDKLVCILTMSNLFIARSSSYVTGLSKVYRNKMFNTVLS